jgi:quercetin dioxygenase-like cupin family protein
MQNLDNSDPLVAAANVYNFRAENDNARVLEVIIKPGDSAKMHHHPQHMAYVIKGGQLRLTSGGKTQEMNLNDGEVVFLTDQHHEAVNIGDSTIDLLVVEFKKTA